MDEFRSILSPTSVDGCMSEAASDADERRDLVMEWIALFRDYVVPRNGESFPVLTSGGVNDSHILGDDPSHRTSSGSATEFERT